ncbi:subtilisin-like protein [Fusarium chlamydosporum]
MCNKHNSKTLHAYLLFQVCHFVPGYILENIANSQAVPEKARQAAISTLSADQEFREQRMHVLHSDEHSATPGDPNRAALVGPAATAQPHDPAAVALVLRRAIYDGKNRPDLPGTPARVEGDERTLDRQVNNIYDGVGITVQFFHEVFGRNTIDDNGGTPLVTIHHNPNPAKVGYNNAFWDGVQLAFGDGDGITFDYFTDSLDVIAHELTHAITQYTADIPYEKQAGGLNESISDVFAAMVEQWQFNQTAADADWLTGQTLFAVAFKGAALRNIANPGTAFDDPILGKDRQIAHFSQYNDSLGVHVTSGIPNRAFYLTAIGFGGYSWLKAGKIWYETLIDPRIKRKSEKITFADWAKVTVDQADKLFGVPASIVVRNAWVSVGVLKT